MAQYTMRLKFFGTASQEKIYVFHSRSLRSKNGAENFRRIACTAAGHLLEAGGAQRVLGLAPRLERGVLGAAERHRHDPVLP